MSSNTTEITVRSTLLDGTVLHGRFKIKTRLSNRDSLKLDEIRRSLLGEKSDMANENINGLASVLAKIAVNVVESPSWWKDSNNGLDLEEQGPVMDVFEAVLKAEKDYADDLKKKAEAAKSVLEPELAK
jgi:hypothetical protein